MYKEDYEKNKDNLTIPNKPYRRKVIQLSRDNKFIKEWSSISLASKSLSIFKTNIVDVCKGKGVTAGGFKWTYKEDYDQEEVLNKNKV